MASKKIKEPPLHSIVVDKTGSAWQRKPQGWATSGGDDSWFYTWEQVLEESWNKYKVYPELKRGSVKVLWKPE